MFLFLSKLLPLFLYPLGLASLLMLITLVLLWRRSRLAPVPILLALTALLLFSNGLVSGWLVRSLEWQNIPQGEIPTAEAIVVLGGGVKPATWPRPSPDLSDEGDRVFYGAQLYREGKAPLVIASGGRIDWKDGGPPESKDMAAIMETLGVPSSAILQDPTSLNTYENAVNVRQLLQSRRLRKILLVTSAMHMPRSLLIFKRQGIEAIPAPTDFLETRTYNQESASIQETVLNLVPDADRLQKATRALKEYIGIVVYRLKGWL